MTKQLDLRTFDPSGQVHDGRDRVTLVPDIELGFDTEGAAYVRRRYGHKVNFLNLPAVAVTDSGTGTAGTTVAAGVGVSQIAFTLNLAAGPMAGTSAADLVTDYVPGFKFKLLALDFVTSVAGTGSGATQTAHLEIGATPVTAGTCVITEASTSAVGELTAGAAITGANTGSATDAISVLIAAGGTAFTGGSGILLVTIQNMDTADAFATILGRQAEAKNVTVVGDATVVIARSGGGGVNVKTKSGGSGGEQAGLNDNGVTGNDLRVVIGSVSQAWFHARVRLTSIAAMFFSAGFNENASADPSPAATAGDGAMFVADPTNALSSGITTYATNWLLFHKVNGTDVWADSGVPFYAAVDFDLDIKLNADLKAVFYIDGVLVGTSSTALTSGDTLKVMAAIEATGATQKDFDCRYLEVSRGLGA